MVAPINFVDVRPSADDIPNIEVGIKRLVARWEGQIGSKDNLFALLGEVLTLLRRFNVVIGPIMVVMAGTTILFAFGDDDVEVMREFAQLRRYIFVEHKPCPE